jgi:hypothetical protein
MGGSRQEERTGEIRNSYRYLIAKSQKKKELRIPRRRWEDNIETKLRKAGCEVINCTKLVQDRIQLKVSVITVVILDLPVP